MKTVLRLLALLALAALVAMGVFYWQNLRGVWSAIKNPKEDITQLLQATPVPDLAGPLALPPGFSIEIFARDVPGARAMAKDSFGNWWVSQANQGVITQLEIDQATGRVKAQNAVFRGLNNPHGVAIDPTGGTMLYFAEEDKVSRVPLYSDGSIESLATLPADGGHYTRTVGIGPDQRLYVSVGSSCNACEEKDGKRATILAMNLDGSDLKTVATGLRNAVFFAWNPVDGALWATENSRDLLGDDLPPDELNVIEPGKAYGWPWCYGQKILDTAFATSTAAKEQCAQSTAPAVEIPAHSAPLGITFIPQEGWPAEYSHDLIVAYHGSWNRSKPTGYKLVRIKRDEHGNYQGTVDFATGWLRADGSTLGRPVGVYAQSDGSLYVTDDGAGVIYKITHDQSE